MEIPSPSPISGELQALPFDPNQWINQIFIIYRGYFPPRRSPLPRELMRFWGITAFVTILPFFRHFSINNSSPGANISPCSSLCLSPGAVRSLQGLEAGPGKEPGSVWNPGRFFFREQRELSARGSAASPAPPPRRGSNPENKTCPFHVPLARPSLNYAFDL